MPKSIRLNDLQPGKRYYFKRPNPSRGIRCDKFYFSEQNPASTKSLFINVGESVVFLKAEQKRNFGTITFYSFLLPTGYIGTVSGIDISFQMQTKALKIYKSDF